MENTTAQENLTQTDQVCYELTVALYIYQGMALYAIVATIIITFVEKRRCKAEVCHGRPGLPLPINFLDGTINSIANAAAFGCMLQHLFIFISVGSIYFSATKWLIAPTIFLACFLMSMVYYPIFACLNSSSRLAGSIIGFLYTLFLFLVIFGENYLCNKRNWVWAIYAIVFISKIYLLMLFIYRIVTALCKKSTNIKEPLVKIDQLMHVKNLLQKPQNSAEEIKIKERIIKHADAVVAEAKLCCLHKSLYRCATRTLAINTIVLLFFYYAFVFNMYTVYGIGQIHDYLASNKYLLLIGLKVPEPFLRYIQTAIQVIRVSFIIANIISAIYLIANMVLIYRSQRQHITQIWRGDRSFIPKNCTQTHTDMLVKNLMYAGNQVSHLLGGYLISQIVVFLFCVVVAYFVVLPLMKEVPIIFLSPLEAILPGVVFMFIFRVVLRIICRKAFLQNHYISSDNGEHLETVLALDNRRVYQNLSYFLFFYYMLIGLFRCVYRVIVSMCLGIFYIARMDRSLLFPGYEHRDIGYMTYLGSLEVELHHCHPVVVVFCDQMIKTVKNISTKSAQSLNSPDDPAYENRICGLSSVYTRKVRNRWQKMKTMISNQSLCKTSKTNISFEHLLTARKTLVGSTNQSSYL